VGATRIKWRELAVGFTIQKFESAESPVGCFYSGGKRGSVMFCAAAGRLRGAFLKVASALCNGYLC
jgi:hypothetical protein